MVVAGLTIPYVKQIESTISVPEIVSALGMASRDISEALWAAPEGEQAELQVRVSKARQI